MCNDWIMDDVLGFDPPKAAPTPEPIALPPPPGPAPSKTSDEIQSDEEKERAKRAASSTSIGAISRLTGGLGDNDFGAVKRITLG